MQSYITQSSLHAAQCCVGSGAVENGTCRPLSAGSEARAAVPGGVTDDRSKAEPSLWPGPRPVLAVGGMSVGLTALWADPTPTAPPDGSVGRPRPA